MENNEHRGKLPRLLTYSMAIAELFLRFDVRKEKLWEEKFMALKKTWSLLEWYACDMFDEGILDVIMEKKSRKILDASSIKDVRELGEPPKPHYNGTRWIVSENSVPEEELIWWSKTSLKGPLVETAFNRYMALFRDFYGKRGEEILDSIGGTD